MATLRERGFIPTPNLVNWRCTVTWTPYKPQGSVASQSALNAQFISDNALTGAGDDVGKAWTATDTGRIWIWTGSVFGDGGTSVTYWNSKTVTLHCRASSSADCLSKITDRMAMHAAINTVTYGTPTLGWIDRP